MDDPLVVLMKDSLTIAFMPSLPVGPLELAWTLESRTTQRTSKPEAWHDLSVFGEMPNCRFRMKASRLGNVTSQTMSRSKPPVRVHDLADWPRR
jgi:hypothetical protein